MADARKGGFGLLLIWSFDRLARSVTHPLEVLDELHHLDIQFVSLREQIDTGTPLGRAVLTIIAAISELERSLIRERVKSGLRRARSEGRRLGRPRVEVDVAALARDRERGLSISQLAKQYHIAETTVRRLLRQLQPAPPKTLADAPLQVTENTTPLSTV
jgi:DNA invertase Pin-like site-specific DNA recombinase